MKLTDFNGYVETAAEHGLTKIEPTIEFNLEMGEDWFVTKTKETYVFGSEEEADELINETRQHPGFIGCDKKFKAGKVNKSGEQVKPDTWTVVTKVNR